MKLKNLKIFILIFVLLLNGIFASCAENEKTILSTTEISQTEIIRSEILTPANNVNFNNAHELKTFLKGCGCDDYWLYIDEIVKMNENVFIYSENYCFCYEKNENGKYLNPYISVSFSLYSDFLGTDTDPDEYSFNHSISFLFHLRNIYKKESLRFVFYKYSNDKYIYNNVIFVYSENKQIGEIYYWTKLDVSTDWIASFLIENLKYLK